MLPEQLTPAAFSSYPPEAHALALQNIDLLRRLPLAFLPLMLRELIGYDWKFPAERDELNRQFEYLSAQSDTQFARTIKPFADLTVSAQLASADWVNLPADFSQQLSAYLWASGQIDAFRTASVNYIAAFNAAKPPKADPVPRLGIVVIGKDANTSRPLFRKLRPLGVHYTAVQPGPVSVLVDFVNERAAAHPKPFAHWYIDGASTPVSASALTCVSYAALQPVCRKLQAKMAQVMAPGGGGPELLHAELQRMTPQDLDFSSQNPALSRFQISLLTEGSGTQIFSTTFVQWAAREALRRAQPSTLLARFTPRRREAAIHNPPRPEDEVLDPEASLIDAEMGAYYTWINQQRLPNSDQSRFVVWYEGHNQAVLIAPGLKAGTQNSNPIRIGELVTSLS